VQNELTRVKKELETAKSGSDAATSLQSQITALEQQNKDLQTSLTKAKDENLNIPTLERKFTEEKQARDEVTKRLETVIQRVSISRRRQQD